MLDNFFNIKLDHYVGFLLLPFFGSSLYRYYNLIITKYKLLVILVSMIKHITNTDIITSFQKKIKKNIYNIYSFNSNNIQEHIDLYKYTNKHNLYNFINDKYNILDQKYDLFLD